MSEEILSRPAPVPDELLTWGPQADHVADLFLGSAERPLVLALHGGFWRPQYDRTHLRHLGRAVADHGYSVALLEYRRVPGEPELTMDDVRVCLQVVPTFLHGYFNGQVLLLGHSAGGHLALWAASICPPDDLVGTIAMAPVSDLRAADEAHLGGDAVRDFLGGPAIDHPALDPTALPTPQTPVTVVLGGRDDVVPTAVSDGYRIAHPDVTVVVLDTADHYDVIDPLSQTWPSIVETLDLVSQVSS